MLSEIAEVPLLCLLPVILWTLHPGLLVLPPFRHHAICFIALQVWLGTVVADSSSPLAALLLALLLGSRASPPVGTSSQVAGACVYDRGRMQGGSREKAAQGTHPLPEGPARPLLGHSSVSLQSQCLLDHLSEARALWVLQAWGWKLLSARIGP